MPSFLKTYFVTGPKRSLLLTHPNIVRIHYFLEDAWQAAISMEYVEGKTLAELRAKQPELHFEATHLEYWLGQLAEALSYAHGEGVVHRDLKPANLMVDSRERLKVADFGIARSLTDSLSRLTVDRHGVSGTPPYMSPQQLMGEEPSVSDDIYSLGVLIYELLTGKPPFYSGNIELQIERKVPTTMAERRRVLGISGREIPESWESVVAACMAKKPKERPKSVEELMHGLRRRGPLPEVIGVAGPGEKETEGMDREDTGPKPDQDPVTSERPSSQIPPGKADGRRLRNEKIKGSEERDAPLIPEKKKRPEGLPERPSSAGQPVACSKAVGGRGEGGRKPKGKMTELSTLSIPLSGATGKGRRKKAKRENDVFRLAIAGLGAAVVVWIGVWVGTNAQSDSGETRSVETNGKEGMTQKEDGDPTVSSLEKADEMTPRVRIAKTSGETANKADSSVDSYVDVPQAPGNGGAKTKIVDEGMAEERFGFKTQGVNLPAEFGDENQHDRIANPGEPLLTNLSDPDVFPKTAGGGGTSAALPLSPPAMSLLLEPRKALDAFLTAPTWEERIPYIYNSEKLRPKIESYYQACEDKPITTYLPEFDFMEDDPDPGQPPYYMYYLKISGLESEFPVMIMVTPEGPKVNWEAFVEFKDQHFAAFVRKKELGPMAFRVLLTRESYWGADRDAFTTLNEFLCFSVDSPDNETEVSAFVHKNAPLAKELEGIATWGRPALAAIVEIEWRHFPHGVDHLVINKLITDGWSLPLGKQ